MEEEVSISNLKTDPGIANILNRLKSAAAQTSNDVVKKKVNEAMETSQLEVPADDVQVQSAPEAVATDVEHTEDTLSLSKPDILPWFTEADKDSKYIHYITFDDSGNIKYNTADANMSTEDLASLKMTPNYVCDIDYYKSRHFVLCVKQIESDYDISRSFIPENESYTEAKSSNVMLEDSKVTSEDANTDADVTNPTLTKVPTETVSDVANAHNDYHSKYSHYVVFTDLGVADFLVRQEDVPFPFGESNLSKWFEEISNHVQIKQPYFTPNSRKLSVAANSIKDFKYDIITMHRPGIITLDSVDNQDSDYQVNIQLKDEYSYIPLNRILGCLKYYASHTNKSTDDLRKLLNKYFTFIA